MNLQTFQIFTQSLKAARDDYAVVLQQDRFKRARGEWSFLTHEQFLDISPETIWLPKRLVRAEYLIRAHHDDYENLLSFDVHSIRYAPLFRVEFFPGAPVVHPPNPDVDSADLIPYDYKAESLANMKLLHPWAIVNGEFRDDIYLLQVHGVLATQYVEPDNKEDSVPTRKSRCMCCK